MSERPVNCFKCGGDGHYARNCPQSKKPLMQISNQQALATTAENRDIFRGSAPSPERPARKAVNAEKAVNAGKAVNAEKAVNAGDTAIGREETMVTGARTTGSVTTAESQATFRGIAANRVLLL